ASRAEDLNAVFSHRLQVFVARDQMDFRTSPVQCGTPVGADRSGTDDCNSHGDSLLCILYGQPRPALRGRTRLHRIWLHTVCDLIYCGNGPRLGVGAGGAETLCPARSRKRNTTLIGVPRESAAGERRVALVPKVVERLQAAGLAVVVETGAGTGALIPDAQYEQAGATIGDPWPADLVVKVNPPTADEIGLLKPESTVVGFL